MEGETLLLIPTFNERKNISVLLEKVHSSAQVDILIIDDNSPDGTADVAEEVAGRVSGINVIRRRYRMGFSSAYVEGFVWFLNRNYKILITMDADLSHNPSDIKRFIDEIDHCDLVVGSRLMASGKVAGFSRRVISEIANFYVRAFLRMRIRDATSGYRCYRRGVIERLVDIGLISRGFIVQVEIIYYALKLGFKIMEIPIFYRKRYAEDSKLSLPIAFEGILKLPFIRVRPLLLRKLSPGSF